MNDYDDDESPASPPYCGHCGTVLNEDGTCPAVSKAGKCAFCGCDLNDEEIPFGFCFCCGPA